MWEKLDISLPNKTFLAGEYVALWGGPALVINAEPRFTLRVARNTGGIGHAKLFHPASPAGKFLDKHNDTLGSYEFEFINESNIQGGFGRSSAEFACLHSLYQLHLDPSLLGEHPIDVSLALGDFRECAEKVSSGYDLIGQLTGGICFINRAHGNLKKYDWPFSDIGFSIFSTGVKLNTHEHLKDFKVGHFSDETKTLIEDSISNLNLAFQEVDTAKFLWNLKKVAIWLQTCNLVTTSTAEILDKLAQQKEVLVAKGCGALGSDAVIVVHKSSDFEAVGDIVSKLGLKAVAGNHQLSGGISVKVLS